MLGRGARLPDQETRLEPRRPLSHARHLPARWPRPPAALYRFPELACCRHWLTRRWRQRPPAGRRHPLLCRLCCRWPPPRSRQPRQTPRLPPPALIARAAAVHAALRAAGPPAVGAVAEARLPPMMLDRHWWLARCHLNAGRTRDAALPAAGWRTAPAPQQRAQKVCPCRCGSTPPGSKTPFGMDGFGSIVQSRRPIEPVNASYEEGCAGMREEGLHGPTHLLIDACVRHRHVDALANCVDSRWRHSSCLLQFMRCPSHDTARIAVSDGLPPHSRVEWVAAAHDARKDGGDAHCQQHRHGDAQPAAAAPPGAALTGPRFQRLPEHVAGLRWCCASCRLCSRLSTPWLLPCALRHHMVHNIEAEHAHALESQMSWCTSS